MMLINIKTLREHIHAVIINKGEQGFIINGLAKELDSIGDAANIFEKEINNINSKDQDEK